MSKSIFTYKLYIGDGDGEREREKLYMVKNEIYPPVIERC
jgi:hypothetical protein